MTDITAFHDPADSNRLLVVQRTSGANQLVSRPRPPCKGVFGGRELPPPWAVPHDCPATPPADLRIALLLVWPGGSAVCAQSPGWAPVIDGADVLLTALNTDVLFVCGDAAVAAVDAFEQRHGLRERYRVAPVLCDPDQFVRGASLDRDAAGQPVWYKPPVDFVPDPVGMSGAYIRTRASALIEHRRAWIDAMRIVPTMFALSHLTQLPLHMVARPQQTQIADALIDSVWAEHPSELPPPVINMGDGGGAHHAKFRGASVLAAKQGLHLGWVALPDVQSLYPSTVREFLADEYPLIARLFEQMINARRAATDPITNKSLKVCTNAVFGSRKHGRYQCVVLSERIAALGRQVQDESVARMANVAGVTVLGGDTDALALGIDADLPLDELLTDVVRVLNAGRTHVLYNTVVDVYRPFFFVSNKSWAGVERHTGRIVTRGLMQNRSVAPQFVLPKHEEWVRRVLLDKSFLDAATRLAWIDATARELEQTPHRLDQLLVWPKPTHVHPDTDRGYFVLCDTHQHVPRREYLDPRKQWPPVDVAYLVRVYFADEVRRHHALLPNA